MNFNDVRLALNGYAIQNISTDDGKCIVVIGSAGRDMLGTRTFKAAKFETIIRQVKKVYGPILENYHG